MKIVVICRARNEERNIARFCKAYNFADKILIADGGSRDNTLMIAGAYPNIRIKHFEGRVYSGDHYRNPHGTHINFLIDWALEEGADWIIFDDCDCVPTVALMRDARGILSDTDKGVIELYRLYIWGSREYFPELNEAGQSLWAWRRGMNIRAIEPDPQPTSYEMTKWPIEMALKLEPPLACLHYFCPDEETVKKKLAFYRQDTPETKHPLEGCGRLEELPEWAK